MDGKKRIVTLELDGRELPLLFSLGANIEIAERMGSVETLFDALHEETDEERTAREIIEANLPKKAEQKKPSLPEIVPFLTACLARQGQRYMGETDKAQLISEEWVELHAFPEDMPRMVEAVSEAIGNGLWMRHKSKGAEERDLVLEAIEKN